ncbi:sensor histidine kinase KdpD [cf. Phormidesmis sp. LEGE 11477]|uniref:sensor histidine kinase n=1 Tax=cf. Phormidesmis sp. LEGE 11477 TaxID=1828680 RepID=UPI0018807A99|nr:HAMP domain-containing sensor histidine kinase [cf. Phormidesmis sp. LEGE 11477]MBE9061154.1 HAMP domain-containing histidine kinase [cf. Phormidesmis sp. LEGE 11477]
MDPAYQQLWALERFKSGFLARTSHELRSPINVIISLSQLILEDLCEDPEEEREFIAQSKAAALRTLALFDQIAAVSKLDIGREPAALDQTDLSFLLPEVEMLTALQAANQNIRYTVTAPVETVEICTDRKWLKNTLVSLVQDAIAHTKLLSLFVDEGEAETAIVIECDRAATELQAERDSLAEFISDSPGDRPKGNPEENQPESEQSTDSQSLDADLKSIRSQNDQVQNIQLSTALILATATTTLPLINGRFEITSHPTASDRAHLKCIFPRPAS